MKPFENTDEISEFVQLIRSQFPLASTRTDQLMAERGFEIEDDLLYLWIEALADVTNEFIRQRSESEIRRLFAFFSFRFDTENEKIKNCIEVSYVENLMFNAGTADAKWTWPYFPENLKRLYVAMWRSPDD
jgi:hypothetical protein